MQKTIVEKLIGYGSPFDNAEVLNTELLTLPLICRSESCYSFKISFVNFSTKSTEELLLIENGRRNIIWTLEKLF